MPQRSMISSNIYKGKKRPHRKSDMAFFLAGGVISIEGHLKKRDTAGTVSLLLQSNSVNLFFTQSNQEINPEKPLGFIGTQNTTPRVVKVEVKLKQIIYTNRKPVKSKI